MINLIRLPISTTGRLR